MFFNESFLNDFANEILQYLLSTDNNRVMIIWDEYDEIQLVTKSIERICLQPANEIIGQSWKSIFPESLTHHIEDYFRYITPTLKDPQHVKLTSSKSNLYFSIDIQEKTINERAYFFCLLEDITKIKETKQHFSRIEKAMLTAQMSANIVHEIRNPLTSIKGFLQLIQAGIDHREKYVEVLLSEVEKLEGLTNELLQMSNPHKDRKEEVNLIHLLEDVLLLMKAQTKMRNISFDLRCDQDIIVSCNPHEIKQVFINLITNASDAMDGEGIVTIDALKMNDSIVIKVIDRGHGISQQMIDRIHDEFYTTKKDGTGLGLVVTEEIIQKHRGRLSITSLENQGSTFEITLPMSNG